MKTKGAVLALLAVAVFLSGCATAGNRSILNETNNTVAQKITKGVTTKDEVRFIYGDPLKTEFNANGDLMWTYSIAKEKNGLGDFFLALFTLGLAVNHHQDEKHLVVLFDKDNIVKNFDLTTSESTFSTFH